MIQDCVFRNNTSSVGGGAIAVFMSCGFSKGRGDTWLRLVNATFEENRSLPTAEANPYMDSMGQGGAVYASCVDVVEVVGSRFTRNSAIWEVRKHVGCVWLEGRGSRRVGGRFAGHGMLSARAHGGGRCMRY